ncbi:MAG: cache domain-containing protein, partial [Spirochaetales bacterium]|nr:cache domain-containing protein [Spirochaetales bacterium]
MEQPRNTGLYSRFRRIISQWTIQREITLTIVLCSLLPLVLSNLYLYSRINDLLEKELTGYSQEVINQAVSNIENIVDQADLVMKQVIYWSITNSLLDTSIDLNEKYRLESLTVDYFRSLRFNFPFVTGMYVINENQFLYSDENVEYRDDVSMELVQKIFDPHFDDVVTPPRERQYLSSSNSIQIMSLFKQIRDFNHNGRYGMIQIDVDFRAIESILHDIDLGDEHTIY